jgi:cell division protein FtsW
MPAAAATPAGSGRIPFALSPAAVIAMCAVALTILGLTILFSASASFRQGPYFYLGKQIAGVALAGAACVVVSRLDLELARRWIWVLGGLALLGLVLVLIPGIGTSVNGSRRWLGIGSARVQVSEFGKLALVFCLAHYLAANQTRIAEFWKGFVCPSLITLAFAGLILLEPDFGTAALTFAVGMILLFLAGARWSHLLPAVVAGAGALAVMVIHNPNRLRRFTAFLDVEGNKQAGTYQLYQSLAAFAVGGTEGAGLGQGRQQMAFLPEAHTDFVFAVVGEELGLWVTLGVVVVYVVMFIAGLIHLRRAPNLFQYLLVAGALLLLSLQAVINLGVVTGILPTKGMSLPFISAGLSNLLLMGMLVGIFLNTQRAWTRPGWRRSARGLEEVTA